jgi:hypothetical protein
MPDELSDLRDELCRSTTEFCDVCFATSPHRHVQNPPNVFRIGPKSRPSFFFVFDKPNNNDSFRTSDLVPITVFDPRPAFGRQPSYDNLLRLLDLLGLQPQGHGDPLASGPVHVTNAVKCDKCAVTGETGPVAINAEQATKCGDLYLIRELAILQPKALVFFGKAPQEYACGYATPTWECTQAAIGGRSYWMMRVPHPSPTSYNTHGGGGASYVEPFNRLKALAGIQ